MQSHNASSNLQRPPRQAPRMRRPSRLPTVDPNKAGPWSYLQRLIWLFVKGSDRVT